MKPVFFKFSLFPHFSFLGGRISSAMENSIPKKNLCCRALFWSHFIFFFGQEWEELTLRWILQSGVLCLRTLMVGRQAFALELFPQWKPGIESSRLFTSFWRLSIRARWQQLWRSWMQTIRKFALSCVDICLMCSFCSFCSFYSPLLWEFDWFSGCRGDPRSAPGQIEELRDPINYEGFKRDVASANIFLGSLIFIEDLAKKVVDAVEPVRDNLDAAVVFPSMPEVMRLNKLGGFTMENLGQSKSAIGDFMKKKKEEQVFLCKKRSLMSTAVSTSRLNDPSLGCFF